MPAPGSGSRSTRPAASAGVDAAPSSDASSLGRKGTTTGSPGAGALLRNSSGRALSEPAPTGGRGASIAGIRTAAGGAAEPSPVRPGGSDHRKHVAGCGCRAQWDHVLQVTPRGSGDFEVGPGHGDAAQRGVLRHKYAILAVPLGHDAMLAEGAIARMLSGRCHRYPRRRTAQLYERHESAGRAGALRSGPDEDLHRGHHAVARPFRALGSVGTWQRSFGRGRGRVSLPTSTRAWRSRRRCWRSAWPLELRRANCRRGAHRRNRPPHSWRPHRPRPLPPLRAFSPRSRRHRGAPGRRPTAAARKRRTSRRGRGSRPAGCPRFPPRARRAQGRG